MRKNETIRAIVALFRAATVGQTSGSLEAQAMLAAAGLLIEDTSMRDTIGGEVDDVIEQVTYMLESEGWSGKSVSAWLTCARHVGMAAAGRRRAREQELRASVPAPTEDGKR